ASPHAPALACVLPPFPTRRSSDLGVLRTCGARPLGPPGHSPVPLPLHGGEVLGTAGWWLGPGVLRTCGARPFGPPGHSPVPLPLHGGEVLATKRAGEGNRTLVPSLGSSCLTTRRHPRGVTHSRGEAASRYQPRKLPPHAFGLAS